MTLFLTALFPLLAIAADQAVATPAPSPSAYAASEAEIIDAPARIVQAKADVAPVSEAAPSPRPDSDPDATTPDISASTIEEIVSEPPAPPTPTREDILAKANASLQSVSSAKGGFLQVSPDGTTARGDFYLRRPGRIRFEYADPTPLLIVADGSTVAIEDKDLETVDRVPLNATPLDLFLKKRIDLASDGDVVDVRHIDGRHYVALEDKAGEAEGRLILEFAEDAFSLSGWTTVDPAGGVTRIALFDVDTDVNLPARLFVIEDPEDEEDRRR